MSGQTTMTTSVDASFSLTSASFRARAALLLAAGLAFVIATQMGDVAETARSVAADPELALLLRAMAALKAFITLSVVGVMTWRLGSPVGPIRLSLYALSTSAMAAGPVLIWNLTHVGSGAALLHGGLLMALVLLCRDPAVGARLQSVIDAQRRTLRRKTHS